MILVGVLLTGACASTLQTGKLESGKRAFGSGDYHKAFQELLPVAQAGRPEAEYAVGYLYYYGYGIPRNEETGLYWIGRAAAQRYPLATEALQKIRQVRGADSRKTEEDDRDEAAVTKTPVEKPVVSPGKIADTLRHRRSVSMPVTIRYHSAAKKTATVKKGFIQPLAPDPCLPGRYTLQLYGTFDLAHAYHMQQVWQDADSILCQTTRQNRHWYVVVSGSYATLAEARQSKTLLLPVLKSQHPWPRTTAGLFSLSESTERDVGDTKKIKKAL